MPAPRKYPNELRERSIRLVAEARAEEPGLSLNQAVKRIGPRVGVNPDTLRGWCKRALIDVGQLPGTTSTDATKIKDLEREVKELKRANEILLAASSFLRAGAQPATAVVVALIDEHGKAVGVEPICRVLTEHGCKIAPSTYYAARTRPPAARALRDAEPMTHIERIYWDRKLGRGLYGARKVWLQLLREGFVVARCTVERLMRQGGLRGVRRGKQFITTRPDKATARPPDLVKRHFHAQRPNALWVVDFTYVPSWSGMAFTALVSDVCRIVGWRCSDRMPTELALDALEMALWIRARAGASLEGMIHHSDSEYVGAGVPGLPDPHTDGRFRMSVLGCSRAS